MYPLRMRTKLLLGVALLAGCSESNTPSAPSGHPLAATASAVDGQLYEWTVKCSGELSSYASWSWTTALGTMGTVSRRCSASVTPHRSTAETP